jgi:Zn finger protein HypA/HybF involved in hydrogenase expression
MYYNQISDNPCAYITKNKQRIKQFGQTVYLKDGSEFEIELYNPSRKTVLSKIKINGEFIKGGGIILRPGERVFLERYIDVPRKFKFETYRVDATNQTMSAIASNGDVEIYFYDEQDIVINTGLSWNPTYTTNNYNHTVDTYTTNASDIVYGANTVGISFTTTNLNLTSTNSNNDTKCFNNDVRPKKSKSVETGRVEQGSSSDQEFKTVSKNFNSYVVSTSIWKILPESQKPVEKKDLIDRCSKCSTKIKKSSWKFCPECGNELKQETYEDQLNKLSKEELIELLKNK